jgi:holin-like protein
MKLFTQVILIFLLCYIGDIISLMLPFPFPGSVLALILLFLLLLFKVLNPEQINLFSDFLLKHMSLVFVPSTVSIIAYLDVFSSILWKFLIVCCITTVFTFYCTAYTVKLTMYLLNKRRSKNV